MSHRWCRGVGPGQEPSVVSLHTAYVLLTLHESVVLFRVSFPDCWKGGMLKCSFFVLGRLGRAFQSTSYNSNAGGGGHWLLNAGPGGLEGRLMGFSVANHSLSKSRAVECLWKMALVLFMIISSHMFLGFLFGLTLWLHIISIIISNQPHDDSPTFSLCLSGKIHMLLVSSLKSET